ncbi:MAG: transposase [Planctomycetes bacterium]|nr:transposase [Planctomycetota bacterium]
MGRARYRQRKGVVEPVFGWVKHVIGFRAFSLRGLRKVAGEWSLVCMALNLRRMAAKGVGWRPRKIARHPVRRLRPP